MTTMQRSLALGISAWKWVAPSRLIRLLANVRFAAAVVTALVVLGLVGVLVPQVPEAARVDSTTMGRWLDARDAAMGPVAGWLYRLGIFDIFHSAWMAADLVLLAASVVACTARRFAPIWRNVRHPVKVVPDAYLDSAHYRFFAEGQAVDATVLEGVLRRHHYSVERWQASGAEWLFADRYPWAQLATFLSHAALVLLITAGLVTHFTGFTARLFVANGGSDPVFPMGHSPAINVAVTNATSQSDSGGSPAGSSADLSISKNGTLAKVCTVTVTQPCTYDGYRFRQAFYYPYGADLQVRDVATGRVLYRDAVPLTGSKPAPRLTVTDSSGQVVLDEALAFSGAVGGVEGTSVTIPGVAQPLWAGLASDASGGASRLVLFEGGNASDAIRLDLPLHGEAIAAGLRFGFTDLAASPDALAPALPLPPGASAAVPPTLQLLTGGLGQSPQLPQLSVVGVGSEPFSLKQGETATVGGYEYTFLDQKPFVGVEVKKDRGELLVWIGSGMLVLGLCLTLWLPRRRLWAKVGQDGLRMAGQAPRTGNLRRELEALASEAAAPPVPHSH